MCSWSVRYFEARTESRCSGRRLGLDFPGAGFELRASSAGRLSVGPQHATRTEPRERVPFFPSPEHARSSLKSIRRSAFYTKGGSKVCRGESLRAGFRAASAEGRAYRHLLESRPQLLVAPRGRGQTPPCCESNQHGHTTERVSRGSMRRARSSFVDSGTRCGLAIKRDRPAARTSRQLTSRLTRVIHPCPTSPSINTAPAQIQMTD